MLGRPAIIWGGSLVLHASLGLSVAAISPEPTPHAPTKITIREVKPAKPAAVPPPPEVPPPPPPAAPAVAPPKPRAQPKPAAPETAPPAAATPASASAAPSFGLTLSGGGVGSGGIAVAAPAPAQPAATTTSTRRLAPKPLARAKPAADSCGDAPIKPKPLYMPQPLYAQRAREANIAGKVRVELRVDASGAVLGARVLEGLGYGLDEAALDAARAARFEPATLCGKATEATFVVGMRFSL